MSRKIYYWKLRDAELQLGERTLIMGVLNITPDSFSDGGRFNDPDRAYARALELEEQGADIVDIGAESTRPGSGRITADEEWQRLVPVLKRLRDKLRIPLSLDTYKSEIAERALQYGVHIFNDPSGLTFDPGLAKVAANGNAGLILNHMRGTPETWAKMPPMADPLGTIANELNATVSRARHAGVERTRIVIDPGLGFGKRKEQNSEILGKLGKLAELDYPILIGASRKSFLSQQTEADTSFATAAAVAIAALNGAHIVRVHDVKQMQSVLLVADEIARATALANIVPETSTVPAVRPPKPRSAARQDEERPRAMRPPLAKPPVAEPPPPVPAEPVAEPPVDVVEAVEADAKPDRPPVVKHDDRAARPPRKFEDRGGDRGKRDGGWAPPAKRGFSRDDRPPKRDGRFAAPRSDRPAFDRTKSDRPRSDRPAFDRTKTDRPKSDRPRFDRPGFDRTKSDRPGFDRTKSDRPGFDRPKSDRPGFDRPKTDRANTDRPKFDRPKSDRPGFDRPKFGRPGFDRPKPDRATPDRAKPDRAKSDRPGFGRSKPRDARGGRPRPDGGKLGDGRPPKRPFRKRP